MNRHKKSPPAFPARAKVGPSRRPVRFVFIQPDAHEVFVAGSFNNWNPGETPLTNIGQGHWVKDLALPPGRYEYQFVVDGHWLPDRTAKQIVLNPFGGLNSIVVVSAPKNDSRRQHCEGT